jgi:hypothetical protein
MPRLERFPEGFLSCRLIQRNHAQRRPKLMQRAQHRRLGEFAPEFALDLGRGQHAARLQQLPDLRDERGDAVRAGRSGGVLPIPVAA